MKAIILAAIFLATGLMVFGQTLQKEYILNNHTPIDVTSLPAGLYFVRLATETGWVSCRFVKQ